MNFPAHPNFAKTKRGASGGFLPQTPSSSACDIRIQKKGISRSFAESFPQKIVSAKLRPHCFRFLRQDCFQKRFEFCTMNTAIFRKGFLNQKYCRHEVPSVLNSPQK